MSEPARADQSGPGERRGSGDRESGLLGGRRPSVAERRSGSRKPVIPEQRPQEYRPPDRSGPGRAAAREAVPGEAEACLERARITVDPGLRQAVDRLPTAMCRIVRYHFGWEHADGTPAAGHAGKAVRPALVLTTTEALGGAPSTALRPAAAVELIHNFTLLHDDVMDQDRTRRHRPTAWTVFGRAEAILAGDALQAQALRELVLDVHPAASAAAARLASCVVELCEGQHADVTLESRPPGQVSLEECLTMAEAKTGALLGCACALGGLYAGAGARVVDSLDAFGRRAGLAFQLIDDVIGLWGDPRHTGKPAGADLLARKKSLPVVAALTSGTRAGEELAEIYAGPVGEGDVPRCLDALERAGARDWAQEQAADHMAQAVEQLARAVRNPRAAEPLLALAEFVTRRTL